MDDGRWPDFVTRLPRAEVPVPGLDARVIDDGDHQVALFDFAEAGTVPEHTHADKWGVVVAGQMVLTVDGATRTVGPGDTYFVSAGVPHGADVEAGSRIIEIFAEQRFRLDDRG